MSGTEFNEGKKGKVKSSTNIFSLYQPCHAIMGNDSGVPFFFYQFTTGIFHTRNRSDVSLKSYTQKEKKIDEFNISPFHHFPPFYSVHRYTNIFLYDYSSTIAKGH